MSNAKNAPAARQPVRNAAPADPTPWRVYDQLSFRIAPRECRDQVFNWLREYVPAIQLEQRDSYVGSAERFAKSSELLLGMAFAVGLVNGNNGVEEAFESFDKMLTYLKTNTFAPKAASIAGPAAKAAAPVPELPPPAPAPEPNVDQALNA